MSRQSPRRSSGSPFAEHCSKQFGWLVIKRKLFPLHEEMHCIVSWIYLILSPIGSINSEQMTKKYGGYSEPALITHKLNLQALGA